MLIALLKFFIVFFLLLYTVVWLLSQFPRASVILFILIGACAVMGGVMGAALLISQLWNK